MRLSVTHVGKYYFPFWGGMESHLHVLGTQLKKEVQFDLVVSNEGRHYVRETYAGVEVTRLPNYTPDPSIPVSPGLYGFLRRCASDVLHFHAPNPVAELTYLLARPKGKLVVTYHFDPVRLKSLTPLYRLVFKRFARQAEALIVTSPNYAATSPLLRDFRNKVTVVPYGINLAQFELTDEIACEAERIRARHGPRLLLFVGRLIYYKGLDVLIRALQHVDARVLLLGRGNQESPLRDLAHTLGVSDKVVFLGGIAHHAIAPYYYACDAFVLPSTQRSEAFGIVQLEAMACGRPVVSTALDSGVPYVNLDGVTGIVVPPGAPEPLAAALNRLLDDPERRRRYGAAGRERVQREFTQEIMAARVAELYRRIV